MSKEMEWVFSTHSSQLLPGSPVKCDSWALSWKRKGISHWIYGCSFSGLDSFSSVQWLSLLWLCNPMNCSTGRLLCPLLFPRVHSNSWSLSWSCYLTISSSTAPFSFCFQSFLTSGSLPMAFCIRWPKYWSFSFSISPSNEHSGLTAFRIDWFDSVAVQGTLKSPFQHHSWKASILQHSVFSMVQLSYPYKTTGKNIALTTWAFIGKAMSLLFSMLSGFIIAFFPRSKL